MPFDGVNHAGSVIGPYHTHSNAPATSEVLARSLSTAYMVSRQEGRVIGVQTYRRHFSTSIGIDDYTFISQTSYVDIAMFRKIIPSAATHVYATAWFAPILFQPSTAYLKVTLLNGSPPSADEASGATANAVAMSSGIVTPDQGYENLNSITADIAVSGSSGVVTQVNVAMYIVSDSGSVAQRFQPAMVVGWWSSYG